VLVNLNVFIFLFFISSVISAKTLEWQPCSANHCLNEPQLYTWQEALNYCANLKLNQHTNWRLPNRNELISLIDFKQRVPAINIKFKSNTKNNIYWSSSTNPEHPYKAYYTSFFSGYSYPSFKGLDAYVRCVRNIEP